MATLKELTARMKTAVGADSGLGKSIKLNMGSTGVVFVDGGTVSNEDLPADLVLTVSIDDLVLLGKGQVSAMELVMNGRMQFSEMGLALSLQGRLTTLFSKMN